MGVLRTLLWKNFRWCARHPIKTAFFYLFPLGLCGFLWLISSLIGVKFSRDCDYDAVALPPSHPALIVQSMACSQPERCASIHSEKSETFFKRIVAQDRKGGGGLCARGSNGTGGLKLICSKSFPDMDYRSAPDSLLIYRGQLLYYPISETATNVIELMVKYLDKINALKLGQMMFPNVTLDGNLTTDSVLVDVLQELSEASMCYRCLQNRTFGFSSQSEALQHAHKLDLTEGDSVWALVEFIDVGHHFKYSIASHYGRRGRLSTVFLQALIESSVVQLRTGNKPQTNVATKFLPSRCHKEKSIYNMLSAVVSILVSLGVVVVAHSITSEMCFEKAAGLLEFLFIAGVPRFKVKMSWFIFGLVFLPSVCLIICLIIKYINSQMMEYTDVSLMVAFFLLYGLSLLCLCFLISSLMSTAQKAGTTIIVLLLMAWLPPQWAQILPNVGYSGGSAVVARIVSLLHCSIAAQIGFGYMVEWEKLEIGAHWSNLSESPIDSDSYGGIMEAMVHMLLQCVFYLLFSWYFDYTAPSKYGIKLPWYFPFTKAYWSPSPAAKHQTANSAKLAHKESVDIEPIREGKAAAIEIEGLTKIYGKNKALDGLTLTLYKNDVTALLGHNGAGKSTAMNMLTGMIMPTDGTAIIDGQDIRVEMKTVRQNLGYCPQYDIVYPELTVQEHMRFYGELKGLTKDQYVSFANDLFKQMKMEHAVKTPAMKLSGGMRRKLSITISFLGNPTTVILDEPTSAIDPFSRRAIWDVVLSLKETTTCLISTHYMQEADVLGDRVAIINHGRLKCVGSTMYLKEKYGNGSFLKLAHMNDIEFKTIEKQLQQFIPTTITDSTRTETILAIPLQFARSKQMIDACEYLETEGKTHGIVSFGISESTLDQVFFNVAADNVDTNGEDHDSDEPAKRLLTEIKYKNISGLRLMLLQLWAVWVKRFHLMKRSKAGLVFQILMPLLFAALLLFLNNVIASSALNEQRLLVHPWSPKMEKSEVFFAGANDTTPFMNSWLSYGLGTGCMKTTDTGISCLGGKTVVPLETFDSTDSAQCSCNKCPDNIIKPAKKTKLRTGDYLVNLSGRNISRYLLKMNDLDIWGGLSISEVQTVNPTDYIQAMPVDTQQLLKTIVTQKSNTPPCYEKSDFNDNATAQSALTYYWSVLLDIPAEIHLMWAGAPRPSGGKPTQKDEILRYKSQSMLNGYFNVLLRSQLQSAQEDHGISLYTEEVSMTKDGLSVSSVITGIILGMFTAIALIMPTFPPLLVLTAENASGNKQLQYLMGMHPVPYWIANILWDATLFLFSVLLVIGFMLFFPDTFTQNMRVYFYCCICFGVGMILGAYVLSFLLRRAHVAVLLIFIFTPFFAVAALVMLNFREENWFSTADTILAAMPPYFISEAVTIMALAEQTPGNDWSWDDWDVLGKRFVCIGVWCLLMVLLVIGLETGIFAAVFDLPIVRAVCCCKCSFKRIAPGTSEIDGNRDPDVVKEETDIQNMAYRDGKLVLAVKRLSKQYGNGKVAVRSVSFGVNRNECFGLLGVNGAGKSTLFKMLTGFHRPTMGNAVIHGNSIFHNRQRVARYMSYCPQEDVLFETLTPGEHLNYYGRIRGIPGQERDELCQVLAAEVGLDAHAAKLSSELSGGNKRKLNFAIALLDFPDCIFLDEMTTGMDPGARRSAWNCLRKAMNAGCATVITSHSMEECEALCNRLVIMVNGGFNCIGGVQYLKDKYGKNYNAKFRLGAAVDVDSLLNYLAGRLDGTKLVEEHHGYLEVEIPAENLLLSGLYTAIHEAKEKFGIIDFSVSQTTLEHVFVNMVKNQE